MDVDLVTGAFIYTPNPNFFGNDSFTYVAQDAHAQSQPASVTIEVTNVNDPPELMPIPSLRNSAETQVVVFTPIVRELDGEKVTLEVASEDVAVAAVSLDTSGTSLHMLPGAYGETTIHVTARDAVSAVTETFRFTVADVTKKRTVSVNISEAIFFANTSTVPVTFTFSHNGFPLFQSDQQIVEFVRAMEDEVTGEPYEHKLWRFVRDNTYHAVQLSNDDWPVDTWVTLNSFGWGLCTQVSAVYIRAARAAGYTSRMWGLEGHVVPEILIDGEWQMYDPDLATFYLTRDFRIASVAALEADPTLITLPTSPIFDMDSVPYPYSELIADIYRTPDNVAASEHAPMNPANYQPLILQPGSSLTYPVIVDGSVQGMHQGLAFEIPHYLQAVLTLPTGWTGDVTMPWIIWGIRGEGTVSIDDESYDIGSAALEERIRTTMVPIKGLRLSSSSSPVQLTFFINALRYELSSQNLVALTGKDVWAIDVGTVTLPEAERTPWGRSQAHRKVRGTSPVVLFQ